MSGYICLQSQNKSFKRAKRSKKRIQTKVMIIDQLHNHVHSYVINQNAFFEVCPIPLNDLFGKTKLHSVATWRSVGMVWMRLSGLTQTQVGEMFNRHHSTVVYAEHSMLDAFDGYNPQ